MSLSNIDDLFVLLITLFKLLASLSVEGCKKIKGKKKGKGGRCVSTQNFISGFNNYSVGKGILQETWKYSLVSQVFKYIKSYFRWVYEVEVCGMPSRCFPVRYVRK